MSLPQSRVLGAISLLAALLAGCNGGESSSGAPDTGGGGGAEIEGQVVKGVTANAVITATAPDGEGGFTLLGSTTSNGQGAYSLTLPEGFQGVFHLTASASAPPEAPTLMRCDAAAGCGDTPEGGDAFDVDEDSLVDFGEWYPVAADFSLRAVGIVDGTGVRIVNLTPLSTLAADYAASFPQGLDERAVLAANTQVAVAFGFQLADFEAPLGDITDPLFPGIADPVSLRLSLLMAAFAEVAEQNDVTLQDFIDTTAALFTGQQGRLREAGDGEGPSLYDLMFSMQTIAGVIDMQDNLDDVNGAIADSLAQLQDGALSGYTEVTLEGMIDKLGPMGAQIDELLAVSGLDDPAAFAASQVPFFDWVLTSDNLQLVPLALETATYAVMGSVLLDLAPTTDPLTLVDDGISSVVLDVANSKLLIGGQRHGQTVDLEVSLTKFSTGKATHLFNYAVTGGIVNGVAAGSINGTLQVDVLDTNLTPVSLALLQLETDPDGALASLQSALLGLMQSARAEVELAGEAQLVRLSDPSQVLGGDLALTGYLDLGAADGETIATLDVTEANLVLPNGDTLYGLEDTPVLTIRVGVEGDDATLVLDGGATMLSMNLPPATAHAEGTLVNARALFEHVRDTLVEQLSGDLAELDIATVIDALLDFDLEQMGIHGEGVIEIPGMPSGDHQYRAALDDLTLTIFQPYSDAVAVSATLDTDEQAVHLVISEEPWDLRLMGTPTPRVVVVGPDGQFLEASQEDLFAFIESLPLGELFAGIAAP